MTGRTTWWAKDAAWHRRELVVELGEEFGPAGPNVLDVLSAWAQEQRAGGLVRGGFRTLAREAFVTVSDAESIVSRSVAIGALDDLARDDDGRRFTCRVSGWRADADRGRAAIRMADMRADAGDSPPQEASETPEQTVADRDVLRPVTPSALPDQTRPDVKEEANASSSSEFAKATPDQIRLCRLLAELVRERDPKAKPDPESAGWLRPMRLLLADREGDTAEVERVLRWSQAHPFWQTNVLCPEKLRKQFSALTIKMKAAPIRAAVDTAAPTRWQERARQWAIEDGDLIPGEEKVA